MTSNAESDVPQIQRQTVRRKVATRLRYSGKPGTLRLARILEARDLAHVVMATTGTEWGGDYGPPFAPTVRYPWQGEERVFANNNDGMELWFGYPDRWGWHIGSGEIKRLTRYLIVDYWIKSRWLGLRRPIYYAALHRAVNRTRVTPPAERSSAGSGHDHMTDAEIQARYRASRVTPPAERDD